MESQLNALLTDTDIWMVCPYDSRIARPDVLADALRTHPERLDGDRVAASPDYLDPARFRPHGPRPGQGLWLARQICESVEVHPTESGCTVRLELTGTRAQEL